MFLGVSSSLQHSNPKEWAKKHADLGLKAINFPVDYKAGKELINEYVYEAKAAGLIIAEVGIWRNVLAFDEEERKAAIEHSIGQLAMAEEIGAKCCVNIAGTPVKGRWDGGYKENFSEETWEKTVLSVQHIIDAVKPVNTKFSIESMPWMVPSGPDEYLKLIKDIDRKELGVHLDLVNMVNGYHRYFFLDEFMEDCFEKLKGKICSCHLKDIRLKEEYTFQLEEVACGEGSMNIKKYIELASKENPEMPMIIEHLDSDEAYYESVRYIKELMA